MTDSRGVDAVERALSLLGCFDGQATRLSLADLSKATGLYKSTILRLLVSLERFGYIQRRDDGRYQLGLSAWRLGAAYRDGFEFGGMIRDELQRLVDVTGETASFYVRDGDRRICLYRCEPARAIRHSVTEGAYLPLDLGASGKVLRAFAPDAGDAFPEVRAAGYAISWGERNAEVAAVAVPLTDTNGALTGAITVSGLITRFDDATVADILRELQAGVARLIIPGR